LILLGWFAWQVIFYIQKIREGGFNPSAYDFTRAYTTIAKLASEPMKDGSVNTVTTDDPSMGKANAPITIVEFGDFSCPYSKEASFTIRAFAKEHPESVRLIYRDFPIIELHPLAQKEAVAATCAQRQGKFWEYHDKLFQNQGTMDESMFMRFANELNLNKQTFETCLQADDVAQEVQNDYQAGLDAGVRGTPTFFVNNLRIPGSVPKDVWDLIAASAEKTPSTNP